MSQVWRVSLGWCKAPLALLRRHAPRLVGHALLLVLVVALHGLGTWLLLLLALAALLLALLQGQLAAAGVLLAAVVAYELGCLALLVLIEAVASRALRPLAEGLPRPGLAEAWRLLRWLPLALWVYGLATLRAALARRVEWRGVHYRVEGRGVRPLSP